MEKMQKMALRSPVSRPGWTSRANRAILACMRCAMLIRSAAVLAFAILPALSGDWNPKLAEQYLDSRQKEWVAWPHALESGVACVSCHTGLPYLVARPAL